MKAPTVLNMKSSKGNKVPNQFIIWMGGVDNIAIFSKLPNYYW